MLSCKSSGSNVTPSIVIGSARVEPRFVVGTDVPARSDRAKLVALPIANNDMKASCLRRNWPCPVCVSMYDGLSSVNVDTVFP